MDRFLVPADVQAALDRAGFRCVDVVGAGWLAADASGRLVELHVVPAVADDELVARVARLRGVRHEHLAQLLDLTELSPGRLGLVVEHVDGPTLAQIRAARAPLAAGEAATVAIPVAGALGALHDVGLTHSAVTASAVVVRPDGRPVLTDLHGAVLGAGEPEADVRRLVTTVLAQLPGEDVDVAGETSLRRALVDLLAVPGLGAAHVVDRCYREAEPSPVRLPDAGTLASSALAAGARGAAAREPSRRARRVRPRRRGLRMTLAVLAVVVAFLAGRQLLATPPASASAVRDRGDPVSAASELSRLRAVAVGAGDAAALDAVEVPGGPAHTADVALLHERAGARVDGLVVDVQDAWSVAADGSRGSTTDVAVTAVMSSSTRAPAPARTVVLGLRWTDDGWRVWDVAAP